MFKTCRHCHTSFEIQNQDLDFYQRVSPRTQAGLLLIPAPNLCPQCRLKRRLVFRNINHVCSQKSHFSGTPIFSMYIGGAPYPVISNDEWWSDNWDAKNYAREFDFSRPFFEQWRELRNIVPHSSLSVVKMENSSYCNNAGELKNCYFVFNSGQAEDCMYSENLRASRNCLDCFRLAESELCYDCIECTRCYRVQSSERCIDCADSYYLLNCRSCRNCFGCVNLRRAEFCIYNQKVSPSEYQSFITRLALDSFSVREKLRQDFANFALQHPRPHITCSRTEDIRGDFIFDARNVLDSHFIRSSENMRYCFNLERENKDCYDVSYFGAFAELIYESTVCGRNSQSLRFCHDCWDGCSELTYCDYCPGSSNCFGCVGLKKQSYCILNRQFTQTEYEKLLTKIVAHMQKTEEWGEFFPANFTPFPYNISVAQRYFPLTEQEALTQSFRWAEKELPQANQTLEAHLLPDRLPASNSAIVVKSALSSKAFKITSEEIRRYRTFNVPLPRLAYDERMELRAQVLGGLNLFHRKCDKSGKEIVCGYPPESPYIIWDKDEFDREFQ